jgi:hypothetical protein
LFPNASQLASQPASQEPILAQLTSMTASLQAMTSVIAAMKAGNDELKLQMSNQHKTLVTRMENISESMVVSGEVSNDMATMVTNIKPLITEMAKDVQRNRFDQRAQMTAGLAKLQRYVKCDDLTQAFQAFMACIGVRRGIAVMALEAIALDREGTEDKGDHAYQICLTTLFTYNVLGHFTQGGPK